MRYDHGIVVSVPNHSWVAEDQHRARRATRTDADLNKRHEAIRNQQAGGSDTNGQSQPPVSKFQACVAWQHLQLKKLAAILYHLQGKCKLGLMDYGLWLMLMACTVHVHVWLMAGGFEHGEDKPDLDVGH